MARGMTREEKIRQLQRGAYRSYGADLRFWIVFGPWIARGLAFAAVIGVAYWTWAVVPHVVLGVTALSVAGGAATALLWPKLSGSATRKRMIAAALGDGPARFRMGWAFGLLMFAGASLGWLALWSPYS